MEGGHGEEGADPICWGGKKVTAIEDEDALAYRPWEDNGLERPVERPDDAVGEAPDVAYIETDGVFPITREVDEERSQPQLGARGGKGLKYAVGGKEVKNAVLYTADNCVEARDEGRGSALEKTYVSHLGHCLHFAALGNAPGPPPPVASIGFPTRSDGDGPAHCVPRTNPAFATTPMSF